MSKDRVLGTIALAMAGAYYLMADAIQQTTLADAVGPQGLPKAYAAILAALAVVLIARGKGEGGRGEGEEPSRHWRAAGLILIGVAYIAVVPWLGYALSVAALLAATARYQGGELTGRVMLVAVAGAACFWLLFVVLLRIPQPAGVWPSLF